MVPSSLSRATARRVRSTQFFEFIAAVVQNGERDDVVISPELAQPVSRIDVAEALAELTKQGPLNRTVEMAGPERFRLSVLATEVLTAYEDPRRVVADPEALYFGAKLNDQSLLPSREARIGKLRFEDWLRQSLQPSYRPGFSGPAINREETPLRPIWGPYPPSAP
jgi:uncharacterized protein YbjT (DUF2867 family)